MRELFHRVLTVTAVSLTLTGGAWAQSGTAPDAQIQATLDRYSKMLIKNPSPMYAALALIPMSLALMLREDPPFPKKTLQSRLAL